VIDKTIDEYKIFDKADPPNQVLVNKYKKSDVLGLHVEDTDAFGDIIVGVSMGSMDYLRLMNV
jgi:alkylated DNA repair dioxygenase AlkB